MPKAPVVHYNPPPSEEHGLRFKLMTRCGRELRYVRWTGDRDDVTCNTCRKYM